MKNTLNLLFIVLSISMLLSCSETEKNTNKRPDIDVRSYLEGQKLYTENCSSCHGDNGKGMGKMYPPLEGSDYLMKNKASIPCIIKNGLEGKIEVNGQEFEMPMPGFKKLNSLQITDISNFITNSWGNQTEKTTEAEVKKTLENCQ